jgi:hypothetical protein
VVFCSPALLSACSLTIYWVWIWGRWEHFLSNVLKCDIMDAALVDQIMFKFMPFLFTYYKWQDISNHKLVLLIPVLLLQQSLHIAQLLIYQHRWWEKQLMDYKRIIYYKMYESSDVNY